MEWAGLVAACRLVLALAANSLLMTEGGCCSDCTVREVNHIGEQRKGALCGENKGSLLNASIFALEFHFL